ncbi:hypothetical protein [Candidatus Colwellia aromaticivorans]|nr:hypothetical protein [Candidatus Colwellia aromaticivorans]
MSVSGLLSNIAANVAAVLAQGITATATQAVEYLEVSATPILKSLL